LCECKRHIASAGASHSRHGSVTSESFMNLPQEQEVTTVEWLWYQYATILVKPISKVVVLVTACAWMAYCVYAFTQIKVGETTNQVLPSKEGRITLLHEVTLTC
jgi:hypothetical protein